MKKSYTKNASEKAANLKDKLAAAIESVRSSENWFNLLKFWKSVHHYSRVNRILIGYATGFKATCVMPLRKWNEFGARVKKGAKGIEIWVPRTKKVTDENGNEEEKLYFVTGHVFDISQTTLEKLPEVWHKAEGDSEEAQELAKQIKSLSFVEQKAEGTQAEGYYNLETKNIYLGFDDNANNLVSTFFHEYAHKTIAEQMEKARLDRDIEEVIAESVSYFLCQLAGVDSESSNAAYIATWLKESKIEVLDVALDYIAKVASTAIKELKTVGIDIEPVKGEALLKAE